MPIIEDLAIIIINLRIKKDNNTPQQRQISNHHINGSTKIKNKRFKWKKGWVVDPTQRNGKKLERKVWRIEILSSTILD